MSSINKVIIVGYLGKDPEIKHFDNGTLKANFSVATSETFYSKEKQKITNTEWHNIVTWKKLAEIAEKYLCKGKLVYIEGKLQTRSWNDNTNNIKKYITEIIADKIVMLGKKNDDNNIKDNDLLENNQNNSLENDLPF